MGTTFNPNRTFGVEIETTTNRRAATLASGIQQEFNNRGINQTCHAESYNHQTRAHWKIVSDATVRGWEVVSPPLKGLEAKEEISAVLTALRNLGCGVNIGTGLHVHHDARGLTGKQIGMVLGTYAAFQPLLNYGVAQSRRGREFGGYNSITSWDQMTERGSDKWDRVQPPSNPRNENFTNKQFVFGDHRMSGTVINKFNHGRANSINVNSLHTHGTIEFRQHQGTLNTTKIWSWILVTQSMVERSVQGIAKFPQPFQVELLQGKTHQRGEFYRFKRFIGIIPKFNNQDAEACEPYMWAFKQLGKNIKKFAQESGLDHQTIGKGTLQA